MRPKFTTPWFLSHDVYGHRRWVRISAEPAVSERYRVERFHFAPLPTEGDGGNAA